MSAPRKHHYLPQFYLRGFASSAEKIIQIEKSSGRHYSCSIRDAAAVRDFHRLDSPDAEDPSQVERDLSGLEARFAEGLRFVLENGLGNPHFRSRMAQFVNLMRFRVPAFKDFLKQHNVQLLRDTADMLQASGRLPPPPAGFPAGRLSEYLDFEVNNWYLLLFMFLLAAEPRQCELLEAMTPSLIHAPQGSQFLTSDQPVSLFHPTASKDEALGVGLADALVQVALPLSTNALLLLSWSRDAPLAEVGSEADTIEYNRRTIINADSYVFASNATKELLEQVKRFKGSFASLDFDVRGSGRNRRYVIRSRPVLRPEAYRP